MRRRRTSQRQKKAPLQQKKKHKPSRTRLVVRLNRLIPQAEEQEAENETANEAEQRDAVNKQHRGVQGKRNNGDVDFENGDKIVFIKGGKSSIRKNVVAFYLLAPSNLSRVLKVAFGAFPCKTILLFCMLLQK